MKTDIDLGVHIPKRALISVSDKTALDQLAPVLSSLGVEIIASGGTARFLGSLGIPTTPIESVTGNPEAFGGRMKTLSFAIGSSLLFRRGHAHDEKEAAQLGIHPIDLVVCNLYPFEEARDRFLAKEASVDELIENIDVGGPTMVRAAAKNHAHVAVLTNPAQYASLLLQLRERGGTTLALRRQLAREAFALSAHYEAAIAEGLEMAFQSDDQPADTDGPPPLARALGPWQQARPLRYGENPHQPAWVLAKKLGQGLAGAHPLQGKDLSYNNLLDADAALRCASDLATLSQEISNKEFSSGVVIVKHGNPCGMTLGPDPLTALARAWKCDPVSAFGGILAFTDKMTGACAQWLSDKFTEVIVAPSYSAEALEIFAKKKNVRLLAVPLLKDGQVPAPMVRAIDGGLLLQAEDHHLDAEFNVVTKAPFFSGGLELARFATVAAKHLKSNAIALAKRDRSGLFLAGAGMGNPNRLVSVEQAAAKAREIGEDDLSKAVLASDAFFPFADGIEMAAKYGVKTVVQPGGSIKDKDVVEACDRLGVCMALTGRRHFRH